MNRQRLTFVTEIFLNEMRRQAVSQGNNTTIKRLKDYPAKQRSALMNSVQKAIAAADPASDEAFKKWVEEFSHDS